jgi:hypothetical protein
VDVLLLELLGQEVMLSHGLLQAVPIGHLLSLAMEEIVDLGQQLWFVVPQELQLYDFILA